MATSDDIEARVTALETQVARVTALETQVRELTEQVRHSAQDAAAARVLAGGADRDVTEIRAEIRDFRKATTASFNAMREDFTDLRADFTDLRTEVNARFAEVDRGFAEMHGKFDAAAAGQQQIVSLLTTLIDQQDGPGAGR
jgi:chromosome segregation ATPase